MNLDDMKNAWNNDSGAEIAMPENIEKLKLAGTPVVKIRKMMKREFFVQLQGTVIIALSPYYLSFKPVLFLPFYSLYTIFALLSIYYSGKLYFFSKRLSNSSLNSKDSLYEVYYDVKLHIELYRSWCYSLSPFMLFFLLIYIFNTALIKGNEFTDLTAFSVNLILKGLLLALPMILMLILMTEYWIKIHYGKYAKELKTVLDELSAD